jgi:hypothetical protein
MSHGQMRIEKCEGGNKEEVTELKTVRPTGTDCATFDRVQLISRKIKHSFREFQQTNGGIATRIA